MTYSKGKDLRASLIYHWYEFADSNPTSSGENNYQGHQILAEFFWKF